MVQRYVKIRSFPSVVSKKNRSLQLFFLESRLTDSNKQILKQKDMKKYLVIVMALCVALASASCVFSLNGKARKGQKVSVVNKDVPVESFEKIEMAGGFDITFQQLDSAKVRIQAPANVLEEIEVRCDGHTLYVGPKRKKHLLAWRAMHDRVKIFVSSPDLTGVDIAGSGEFDIPGSLDTDHLSMSIAGSGDIDLSDVICDKLDATIAGSGDIEIGKLATGSAKFSIAGSGDIEAFLVTCGSLDVDIAGSGDVKLTGQTKKYHESVAGSGSVDKSDLTIAE
jgi:hypothetical protein